MMKAHYRGVEYAIHSNEAEWSWDAHPKQATGLPPMHGMLKGTQSDAMRECLVAIDKALDG
jgi:hypothetical protein